MLKTITIVTILFFSCCNLSSKKHKENQNEIKGIILTDNFPLIDKTGKLESYDTLVTKIYYYRDLTLYQLSYHYDSSVENVSLKSETRHHYFVHKNGDVYGYDYDEHKPQSGSRISADSLFKKEWCMLINPYPILIKNNVVLISSQQNADSGILEETYLIKGKSDTTMSGTVFLSFSNTLKNIDYSLSRELDSIKKMKLYTVRMVNNSRYIKDYNITLDRIEQRYTLKEIPVIINYSEIKGYFDRYDADNPKRKRP